ncbi:MAG: LysR substrate-binding domain-containing protein [Methylocella sp.]
MAHVLLPKVAADFVLTYPQVELEIVAEDREVDPVEDNYDLVLRVDPNHDERLVGRRIVEDQRLLVAPPWVHVALRLEHEDGACGWRYRHAHVHPATRQSCDRVPRQLRGPSGRFAFMPGQDETVFPALTLRGCHPSWPAPGADHRCLHPAPRFIVPAV